MIQESLGELIKRKRDAAGLSQKDVAHVMGVSQQAVADWEGDDSQPRRKMLVKLPQCLGATDDEVHLAKLESVARAMLKDARAADAARVAAQSASPAVPAVPADSVALAGLGLMGRLAGALEGGQLQASHIAVLDTMLATFVQTSRVA